MAKEKTRDWGQIDNTSLRLDVNAEYTFMPGDGGDPAIALNYEWRSRGSFLYTRLDFHSSEGAFCRCPNKWC